MHSPIASSHVPILDCQYADSTQHSGEVTIMAFRFDQVDPEEPGGRPGGPVAGAERGHQRLEPMHLLAALLDPEQQVIRALLDQLGVNPAQVLKAAEEGLNALPKVTGGEQTSGPNWPRCSTPPRPRPTG